MSGGTRSHVVSWVAVILPAPRPDSWTGEQRKPQPATSCASALSLQPAAVACLRNDSGDHHSHILLFLALIFIRRDLNHRTSRQTRGALRANTRDVDVSKQGGGARTTTASRRKAPALVVERTGILASPARYLGAVNTKVRKGRIVQPGGHAALFSDRGTTQFRWATLYRTDVEVRDDVVVLDLVSRDIAPTIDKGSTVQMRYKGQVESPSTTTTWERRPLTT